MLVYENKMGTSQVAEGSVGCCLHLHHHIELVYIYEGTSNATIGNNNYILTSNSVAFVFPNQIHGYEDVNKKRNKSYMLIYSPDDFTEFKDIFDFKIPTTPVIYNAGDEIKELFKVIIESHNSDHPYKKVLERGYTLVLLSKLFKRMEFTEQNPFNLSTIQNILLYCDNNYTSDISLEKIAVELYISKFYISHVFNEKIKISFSDYINSLRINDAMQQLKSTTENITDIAFKVGYKNIRSFNRQFITQVGQPPNEYRKANQLAKH